MAGLVYLVVFLQLIIFAQSNHTPTIPSNFSFSTLAVLAANGSSAVGGCSDVTLNLAGTSTCNNPSSSVLFDGNIPTLAALDGDTWARQLMILHRPEFSRYSTFHIEPEFTISSNRRVEVTIFNCPQWGTGVERILITYRISGTGYYSSLASAIPTVISCTSLLKVCMPFPTTASYTGFGLGVFPPTGVKYVHIAEIAFYSSSTPCPPFTTIPGTWTPPPPDIQNTTWTPHSTQTEGASAEDQTPTKAENPELTADEAQGSLQVEFKDSSLMAVLAVFATIMTLQTTVIFIVVTVKACRRKNSTPSASRTTTHKTFEMEDQVYETVDPREIISERGKTKVQFMKNESYAIPKEIAAI